MLNIPLLVTWEYILVEGDSFASVMIQEFERYGENNVYKYGSVGWSFRSSIDTLQRDNEKPRKHETGKGNVRDREREPV